MMVRAMSWFIISFFLLIQANEHSVNGEQPSSCNGDDSVTLLQSKAFVDFAEDGPLPSPTAAVRQPQDMQAATEAMAPSLLTRQSVVQLTGSGSAVMMTLLVVVLMLCLCWLLCAFVSYSKSQRKDREQLESRVTSVLAPQNALESAQSLQSSVQTSALLPNPGLSPQNPQLAPGAVRQSPFMAARTPFATTQAMGTGSQDLTGRNDMPPPLTASSVPLAGEARIVLARDALSDAHNGGDIPLKGIAGAPHMRANIRKVDGEPWLEVTELAEGSVPSAMVRLVNKESAPKIALFGPTTPAGPEIFGPDGSFYGTLELGGAGAKLISSTTAQPVLTIEGNMKSLQLAVRTPAGLELASVSCLGSSSGNDNFDICVHRGADLGLVISSVLTVLLSLQV